MDIVVKPTKAKRKSGGSKKIGRMSRKPAHKRYNAEQRWEKNKERRLKKAAKRAAYLKARKNKGGTKCQKNTPSL